MEDDREIDDDYRKQISQEYNLDYDKLMKDLKGKAIGLFLLENLDAAKRLRVRSTPTFVFGDLVYERRIFIYPFKKGFNLGFKPFFSFPINIYFK